MELKDTVDLMLSDDYKERFVAEYWQLKIRYERLKKFNQKIDLEERYGVRNYPVPIIHDCPSLLLIHQQDAMEKLLGILEKRAMIENIDLEVIKNR